ncbi:MAG: protein kinase [Sterolibacteriaceae bacterium]|nr:protein kinase [Sterolibacteriaceae bacterium]
MSSNPPTRNETTVVLNTEVTAPASGHLALPGEHSNALPAGTRLAEFELTGLVGEGGFGIVYLAYDHSLHRQVAVKEYIPSSLANRTTQNAVAVLSDQHVEPFQAGLSSFINEARLLAQFDHPSLLKVYRFWEANGTAYMAMPFYEGVTLRKTLKSLGGPPDEEWLKHLLRPLLDALGVMHAAQCFHRDIAPDNILILSNGRPVLLDFGAARRVIADMTQAPTVILKPGYAPVEQYGEEPTMRQGPWTDIYALAAVVYSAIVGKAPQASISRYMSDGLKPVSRLAVGRYSEAFLRAIDHALSVEPGARPQSVDEFRALLGLGDRRTHPRATTPTLAPPSATPLPEAIASATPESLMPTVPHAPSVKPAPEPKFEPTPEPAPKAAPASAAAPAAKPAAPKVTVTIAEGGPLKVYVLAGILLIGFVGFLVWWYLLRPPPTLDIAARTAPTTPATQPEVRPSPDLAPRPAEPPAVSEPVAQSAPSQPPTEVTKPAEAAAPPVEPAAPPFEPPAPLPSAPLAPAELFDQVLAGRNPQRSVTASVESEQAPVGRGGLRFSVRSATPGYLYVLKLGPDSEEIQLVFPNLADQRNRIDPGETIAQPSAAWSRHVKGAAGVERYIVIVSDQPRDFRLIDARSRGVFKAFVPDSLARLQRDYAGGAPLLAGKPVCPAGNACSRDYGAAAFSLERTTAAPAVPKPAPPQTAAEQRDRRARVAAREQSPARVPPSEKSSTKINASSGRCSDILERASLGEPLTSQQMSYLKKECGR